MAPTSGGFVVPDDPRAALSFDLRGRALKLGVVRREDLSLLNASEFKSPGIYVLIRFPGDVKKDKVDGKDRSKTKVYVGKSAQKEGVRARLAEQKRRPTGQARFEWSTIAAFVRAAPGGLNSAEVGYLEGRLTGRLQRIPSLIVASEKDDQDKSLLPEQTAMLDEFIPSLLAGLRLAGVQVIVPDHQVQSDDTIAVTKSGKKRRFAVSIAQLVEVGSLTAGDVLVYKSKTCSVTADGLLLLEGAEYEAPSSAAKAAYPKDTINGWTAWRRDDGGESLAELRNSYIEYLSSKG